MRIQRETVRALGACGDDYNRAVEMFGDFVDLSPATVARARAAGLNLLWMGVRLLDEPGRAAFMAYTLAERIRLLTVLLGAAPPAGAEGLRQAGDAAWKRWSASTPEDFDARNRATVLREAARDMAKDSPTPAEIEAAGLSVQRAASYAGEDQIPIRDAMVDWIVARVTEGPP